MASRRNRASQKIKTYGVRVNNLPLDITEEQLHLYFAVHGHIESVVVIKRGMVCHGFVNYSTLLQAQQVVEKMNGTLIGGMEVECKANTESRYTKLQPPIERKLQAPLPTTSSQSPKSHPMPTPIVRQHSTNNLSCPPVRPILEPSTMIPPQTPIYPNMPPIAKRSSDPTVKSTSAALKPSIASKPPNSCNAKPTSTILEPEQHRYTVMVSDIAEVTSKHKLIEHFSLDEGEDPPTVTIRPSSATYNFGYISFSSKKGAERAAKELDCTYIDGSKIRTMFRTIGPPNAVGKDSCNSNSSSQVPINDKKRGNSAGNLHHKIRSGGNLRERAHSTTNVLASGLKKVESTTETSITEISFPAQLVSLLVGEYKPRVDQIERKHDVSISTKQNTVIVITGRRGKEEVAKNEVEQLVERAKREISHKDFHLPFHSIPLFEQDDAIKSLKEIEAKHSVEFSVVNGNQTLGTTDIKSFTKRVKLTFSRARDDDDSIPTCEGLNTYFLERRDSASWNGGHGARWYYRDDYGIYVEYSSEQSSELEQMFQTKTNRYMTIKENLYSFNFMAMTQTNIRTYRSRQIQRNQETSCIKRKLTLRVSGLSSSLEPSIHKLQTAAEGTTTEKEFRFYDNSSEDFKKRLLATMNKYFVTIHQMERGMKLIGVRGYVERVHLFAEHEKLSEREEQIQAQMTVTMFAVPSNWEPQKEKIVLNPVRQRSKEWYDEEKRVCQTLQGVTIVRLERIQNKLLWEWYSFAKKQMEKRNMGHIGEKHLFHGTRTTPPDKIYRSEKGVDFRFSREGLWGIGAYFAVNASYSDSYAYSTPSVFNEKQMFICKVLTGYCYDAGTSADKSLRQPPLKPGKGAEEKRYDSVRGYTNGSDVYVIYDHDKVYPAYLVTYRVGAGPSYPASSTYHLPPPPSPPKPAKKDSCIIS